MLWLALVPAQAGPAEEAVAYVEATVAELGDAMAGGGGEDRVQKVLGDRFDLAAMAYATLPEEVRNGAPAAELAAFTAAYRAYLAREFVRRSTGGEEGAVRVLGSRQPRPDFIIVGTKVTVPDAPPRVIEWYVAVAPPPRVLNATVDGVLVTAQHKREFADLLAAKGLAALSAALASDFAAPGDGQ